MKLFQFNQPSTPAWNLVQPNDAVLLKRDAVYLLLQPLPPCTIFVLESDCQARNLAIPAQVQIINFEKWVQLTLQYQQVINCH